MAVPTHDDRDFAFAKKYNLPLKVVINPLDKETKQEIALNPAEMTAAFTEVGVMTNLENSMESHLKSSYRYSCVC